MRLFEGSLCCSACRAWPRRAPAPARLMRGPTRSILTPRYSDSIAGRSANGVALRPLSPQGARVARCAVPRPPRPNSLAGKVSLGDRDDQLLPGFASFKRAAQAAGDERHCSSTAAQVGTALASTSEAQYLEPQTASRNAGKPSIPIPLPLPLPELPISGVMDEFEHKLEADVATVGVTIFAILGVIIFWRGVWVSGSPCTPPSMAVINQTSHSPWTMPFCLGRAHAGP